MPRTVSSGRDGAIELSVLLVNAAIRDIISPCKKLQISVRSYLIAIARSGSSGEPMKCKNESIDGLSIVSDKNFSRTCSSFKNQATKATILRKASARSEEHTSELQSLRHLVCRLLL